MVLFQRTHWTRPDHGSSWDRHTLWSTDTGRFYTGGQLPVLVVLVVLVVVVVVVVVVVSVLVVVSVVAVAVAAVYSVLSVGNVNATTSRWF